MLQVGRGNRSPRREGAMARRRNLFVFCTVSAFLFATAAFARGPGGSRGGGGGGGWHGGSSGGGWHGSSGGGWHGSSGGGWHGGGVWRGSYGGGFRPFNGGHYGWAPWWSLQTGIYAPGYIWPYGVPWVIYPAVVAGYSGPVPDAVPIQPPAPAILLHTGEVAGMNVGLRFQMRCDNEKSVVPTLEGAGDDAIALVVRGQAPGEANCLVGDGETEPLRVHVIVLPSAVNPASPQDGGSEPPPTPPAVPLPESQTPPTETPPPPPATPPPPPK
jgi:hypothetical protein